MAISQSRYVLITSGVGGAAAAGRRELIARLMTTNTKAPTKGVLEFGGGAAAALKNVGIHFGTSSAEYAFASKYFGWVSKDARQADKISFARYTPTATAPQLISTQDAPAVATFTAITDGSIKLSMGGVSYELTGLDFSAATSLADVAAAIQTAVQANTAGGDLWTAATVSFSNGSFILTGGDTGAADIVPAEDAASGTSIKDLVGWSNAAAPIVSAGCAAETLSEALDRIANTSNNFGSFAFVESLTSDQVAEVATWTNAQNVAFLYSQHCTKSNYSDFAEACKGKNGACLTLGVSGDNAHFMPMAIGACINYARPAAATNFMFNQFNAETPTVTDDTMADRYDAKKINYLGATQQAGKNIAFYQRGVLQGDISDIGVYWNEMWLKDAFATEFLNLLIALKQLPANADGSNTARGVMGAVIEEAKMNGTVQAGKNLNTTQKAYITSLTNDEDAWREVQGNGCYLSVDVQEYQNAQSGLTEYKIDYQFIYGKGDSIRKVTGSDILI